VLTGEDIYRRRTAQRKTQNELARRVGVSGGHISNIENGRAVLDRDLAVKIELTLRTWEGSIPSKEVAAYEIGQLVELLSSKKLVEAMIFMQLLAEVSNKAKSAMT
jgi:transcriptional regulator with XRE-family HTH domain